MSKSRFEFKERCDVIERAHELEITDEEDVQRTVMVPLLKATLRRYELSAQLASAEADVALKAKLVAEKVAKVHSSSGDRDGIASKSSSLQHPPPDLVEPVAETVAAARRLACRRTVIEALQSQSQPVGDPQRWIRLAERCSRALDGANS